jgi:hypothetical protein
MKIIKPRNIKDACRASIYFDKKKNYKYNKLFIYKSNIKIIRLENIFFLKKKKSPSTGQNTIYVQYSRRKLFLIYVPSLKILEALKTLFSWDNQRSFSASI